MRRKISSIFVIVLAMIVFQASAQVTLKQDARNFINRTNNIIMKAKGAVEVGKVYTGDVTKAVHHQKYAREMFKQGKFNDAIFHSYRARQLAFAAIKANKAAVSDDMQATDNEKTLVKNIPDDRTLDSQVKVPATANDQNVLKDKEEDIPAEK
jgi:hypothetical protein